MNKLIVVLLSCLWVSCGVKPQTTAQKTISSNMESDTLSPEIIDTAAMEELMRLDEDAHLESEDPVAIEGEGEPLPTIDNIPEKSEVSPQTKSTPSHKEWNTLLATYVNHTGNVNYKGFLNAMSALDNYLVLLAENNPKTDWSKNEKLAYYINLYNAATVKLVLNNYPIKSIKDIKDPWGKAWITSGEEYLSLGDIEHKILRKMNEPRIHFAINCASFSCPKLLNQAFTADQMEIQLEKVTQDFINDSSKNNISEEKIQLSKIFKWYKIDFTENGSLVDYLKPYTQLDISERTAVQYLNYNWNLNEIK